MPSDGLLAPADMLRFAAVYAILILLPGYIVASLACPRRTRLARVIMAIPCSYSLVTIYGLLSDLLRIPFTATMYAAMAFSVALIGAVCLHSTCRDDEGQATVATQPWWLLPVGAAALEGTICALLNAGNVVPTAVDALWHATWTQTIGHIQTFPIALISAYPGTGDGAFYPPTFHAVTAFVAGVAAVPVHHAIVYSVLAIIVMLPAALFQVVDELTGSARLAGLAVLASVAFEPLPLWAYIQGLYPFIASCLFIPALVLVLIDGLGRGRIGPTILAALLGVGLFYTHPTEFLTVALLLLTVLPSLLSQECRWGRRLVYGGSVAGVWLVAALPALAAVHRTMAQGAQAEIRARHDFVPPPHVSPAHLIDAYSYGIYGRNLSYLLGIIAVVGFVWCLTQRHFVGLLIAQVILVAVVIDTASTNVLHAVYALTFPWALMERLAPTHYWITLPLAAVGLDAILRAAKGALWSRGRMKTLLFAAPAVALGLLLPLDVAARHAAAYSQARQAMAPADLGALAWLAHHAPTNAVVLNDEDASRPDLFDISIDAGRWLPLLGDRTPLFGPGGAGPGAFEDRQYLLRHITDDPLPARAASFMKRYNVRYVFYGAVVPPLATRHLNLARLLRDSHLRLAYASAPLCRGPVVRRLPACPATASYVFALNRS